MGEQNERNANQRNDILYYFKVHLDDPNFVADSDNTTMVEIMLTTMDLIRKGSEYCDLGSADTLRPTKHRAVFEYLHNYKEEKSYKEISKLVGGANVKKLVAKWKKIVIRKALNEGKANQCYRIVLNNYYAWLRTQ